MKFPLLAALAATLVACSDDPAPLDATTPRDATADAVDAPKTTDLGDDTGPANCQGSGLLLETNQVYRTVAGVDPNLLSLDAYKPVRDARCPPSQYVIYVHGGQWTQGDKNTLILNKARYFAAYGAVFVSVNHRLSASTAPDGGTTTSAAPGMVTTTARHAGFPVTSHKKASVNSLVGWVDEVLGERRPLNYLSSRVGFASSVAWARCSVRRPSRGLLRRMERGTHADARRGRGRTPREHAMNKIVLTGMLAVVAMSGCAEVVRSPADASAHDDNGDVMVWVDAAEIDAVGVVCGHLGERDVPYPGSYHCPAGWVCHEYGTSQALFSCCTDHDASICSRGIEENYCMSGGPAPGDGAVLCPPMSRCLFFRPDSSAPPQPVPWRCCSLPPPGRSRYYCPEVDAEAEY